MAPQGGQVAEQQERDQIKMEICVDKPIKLVVIHAEDLSLPVMRQKVGDLLPLRNLKGYEQLADYLESKSRPYRQAVRRGWNDKGATTQTGPAKAL